MLAVSVPTPAVIVAVPAPVVAVAVVVALPLPDTPEVDSVSLFTKPLTVVLSVGLASP